MANFKKTGLLALYIGGTKIAHLIDAEFTMQKGINDVTTKDSDGWREICEALKSASWSGNGLLANADEAALQAAYTSSTDLTMKFTDNESGNTSYDFSGVVTNLQFNSQGPAGVGAFSIAGEVNGEVTFSTNA